MKKLIFVFVALFILVLISGCSARNNNTVRFGDEESADITSEEVSDADTDAEEETEDSDSIVETTTVKEPSGKLEVTSFEGAYLKTNVNYNVVRGFTSTDTYSMKINDYKLQKYVPGQTEWSYIASSNYGTMEPGFNSYVVKTFDKGGKQIDSLIFSIEYEAPAATDALPDVGSSHWLILIFSMIAASVYALFRKLRCL